MVIDKRTHVGAQLRSFTHFAAQPIWWAAAVPSRTWHWTQQNFVSHDHLLSENLRLQTELQIANARIKRSESIAMENQRLRNLLGGTRGFQLHVQLADIVDVDLDPKRQRIVLGSGTKEGVEVGLAVIDEGGMLGQVIEVSNETSIALLITDPKHSVPAQLVRSGLRLIVNGTGRSDRLSAANISQTADIRSGDLVITSGIGGRFPAGFPVGKVAQVSTDDANQLQISVITPAAYLDRGRQVLLVRRDATVTDVGPPSTRSTGQSH